MIRGRGNVGNPRCARRFRVSYAGVVASLALVLSLGGVGYAAGVIPANSVGSAQLKPRAVTWRALGVAVGGNAVTKQHAKRIELSGGCGAGTGSVPPCTPANPAAITKLGFLANAPGKLLVSGLAGAVVLGPSTSGQAEFNLTALVDGKQMPGVATVTAMAGSANHDLGQVQYLSDVALPAGRHTVTLRMAVSGPGGDEARIGPVSLAATMLPGK